MRRGVILAMAVVAAAVGAAFAGAASSAPAQAPLKVRVITATKVSQGTWDPSQYHAYSAIGKKQGWDLQIGEAIPYGQADQVLDRWGSDKVDIVFSTDNGFETHMLDAAAKYPDTLWV